MSSNFHHPYRIDDATIQRATGLPGLANLLETAQLPSNVRFLTVNPTVFTHEYMLLGKHPERFLTGDLRLYLSTINTFFESTVAVGGLTIKSTANPDERRRLSEDLGVGISCYFMVDLFALTWDTICQIPQNLQLTTKRPDFMGFTAAEERYLFEAKGTTAMTQVEKALSKATSQVKAYPETAEAKLAIVSYFSADERFFPSTSFVVDPPPPGFPQGLEPTIENARLLHFEKVLQFAGFSFLSKNYVAALSQQFREQYRVDSGTLPSWKIREPQAIRRLRLRESLGKATVEASVEHSPIDDTEFVGRLLRDPEFQLFLGVARPALEKGIEFESWEVNSKVGVFENKSAFTSIFSDGTMLRVRKT